MENNNANGNGSKGLSEAERFTGNSRKIYPHLPTAEEKRMAGILESLEKGGDKVIRYPDGTINVGGSVSWRANNPGNLVYGDFAKRHGAIGAVGDKAIFPDQLTGEEAQRALLTHNYGEMTVYDAIEKYAPGKSGNNVPAYRKFMEDQGIDLKITVSEQLESVQKAIKRYEGFKEGESIVPGDG